LNPKLLLVILGPTAIGKTALSILLAKKYATEIVSADSRQFYKELTIGTAKPSAFELNEIPHHFINSHSIETEVNVGRYEEEAICVLDKLYKTKDVALLTGGSGMYIQAVCEGLDTLPEGDETIRKQLETVLKLNGIIALQKQLKELDPDYFEKVDLFNPHRIMRAIEVCLLSGMPYSSFRTKEKKNRSFNTVKIGLRCDRSTLYERINNRVDNMIADGLIEEAKSLYNHRALNALKTVGYSELFDYFDGVFSKKEAIEKIKQNTRRYAKRQLTWFNKDPNITWFDPSDTLNIYAFIDKLFLKNQEAG
jgi:tRNA dimethylallyltransferase